MQKRLWLSGLIGAALLLGVAGPLAYQSVLPVAAATSKWRGDFYANPNLEGSPVASKEYSELNLDWGDRSPNNVPTDFFSARFTRTDDFTAGPYVFGVRADDGSRVFVDGQPIIDTWGGGIAGWQIVERYMTGGQHTLTVEYNEQTAAAFIEFDYYRASGPNRFWRLDYFPNATLSGTPLAVNYVDALTLDWGYAAPVPGWSPDGWSIRFTKNASFAAETYVFAVRSDDGARMYLDGQLVVDAWPAPDYNWHEGTIKPKAGLHTVTVEFFDATGVARLEAGYYPEDLSDSPPDANKTPTPTRTPTRSSSSSSSSATRRPPTSTSPPTSTPSPTATLPYVAGTPLVGVPTVVLQTGPADLENGLRVSVLDPKRFTWNGFPGLVIGGQGEDRYYYVKNRLSKETAQGRWYFEPEQQGYYDVFVYVPDTSATATAFAIYFVNFSQRRSGPIVVDQNAHKGSWMPVGNYYFGSFGGQYIQLDNVTGEPTNSTQVLYGDALFVYTP